AISESLPPRSSGTNPRRRPWPGRSTPRSRNSRPWSGPGTTSPRAPTTSSWRGEVAMSTRRRFLGAAGGALAAAVMVDAPNVIAQPKVQWRMSTSWTNAFDIAQGSAQRLAKTVDEMSGGRFRIEVFQSGQIMQAFECFDAASQGKIEAFMGSPQYWKDREPAIEWFCTIPFGMNPEGMTAWFYQGD